MLSENVISCNLKALIKLHGINARKLALSSGVPAARLSDILTGKTKDPRLATVRKLAGALDVSIDDLISDEDVNV